MIIDNMPFVHFVMFLLTNGNICHCYALSTDLPDRTALLNDRSLAQPSTDRGARSTDTNSVVGSSAVIDR